MSPEVFTTITLVTFAFLLAALVRFTQPGGLFRVPVIVRGVRYHRAEFGRHAAPWLDAHDVPAEDRHYVPAVRALPAAPAEPSALATRIDTNPFRARTAC